MYIWTQSKIISWIALELVLFSLLCTGFLFCIISSHFSHVTQETKYLLAINLVYLGSHPS